MYGNNNDNNNNNIDIYDIYDTGTDEYNQALSVRRANSAADALRASGNMQADVSVAGHGRENPKFPNDLPEGRQLNRRVEVDIAKSE